MNLKAYLLGKSDAELSGWRDALVAALGPNGPLMIDLVPELKLIIGDQPRFLSFLRKTREAVSTWCSLSAFDTRHYPGQHNRLVAAARRQPTTAGPPL